MDIVQIISEWKKKPKNPTNGMKHVEAIVRIDGKLFTRHINVPK